MESRLIPHLKIFDPRRAEEYVFHLSRTESWSSLQNGGMLVASYHPPPSRHDKRPPSLMCKALNEFTAVCIGATARFCFEAVSPLTSSVANASPSASSSRIVRHGSSIEYFATPETEIMSRIVNRAELVSYEEWIIGSCQARFREIPDEASVLSQVICWDFEYFWRQKEKIGALSVFYGETGELILVSHLFEGIDGALAPLGLFE